MSWFVAALEDEMRRRRINRAHLSRLMKKNPATVWRWMKCERHPTLAQIDEVAAALGWRVAVERNDSAPSVAPAADRAVVLGRVAAGSVGFAAQDERALDRLSDAFEASVYRRHTTGPLVYLDVLGPSMEPEIPDGAMIACARPATRDLPALTPVIARVGEDATLKLLRRTTDRRGRPEIELHPLNRSFDVARYSPSEVAIDYVVLGIINPWRHGVAAAREAPAPLLLRERPSGGSSSTP